tara:strand:+ start:2910 stop:3686 length:777 start_codon:yes stop_codon:yes gene_type:complete
MTDSIDVKSNGKDQGLDESKKNFTDHLIELRTRILRSLGALFGIFLILFFFSDLIWEFFAAPLLSNLPPQGDMIATEPASPFFAPLKLTIYTALFLGMPFILHQTWSFISPGLYNHEKKFAWPLMLMSVILFYGGMAFAHIIVFPIVFKFMATVVPADIIIMPDISRYLDFILKMFFGFGLAFQIPVATLLLAWSGLASANSIAAKRPYAIIGCFILGMILTPPDVISQLLLAFPCWLLFEIGIIAARLAEKPKDLSD